MAALAIVLAAFVLVWHLRRDGRAPLPPGLRVGDAPGEYVNLRDGSVLVFVPGGRFTMGNPAVEGSRPHEETLAGSFIGKVPVTNAAFERFVKETGYETDAERGKASTFTLSDGRNWVGTAGLSWRKPGAASAPPDHPVVFVTWNDASAYCRWAGLDLPTEALWEKAAVWDPEKRAARLYPWGDVPPGPGTPRFANVADEAFARAFPLRQGPGELGVFVGYEDGFVGTSPVGAFPAGASCHGALDMTGNVEQWCATLRPDGRRATRGTGFGSYRKDLPAAREGGTPPDWARADLGFRVARAD